MSFGRYLHDLRQGKGLSQRALADKSGVDTSYVSKLENDRVSHTPSHRTLAAMAAALDVNEMELLGRAEKLPGDLASFADQPGALRFLQRANGRVREPESWDALIRLVESDDFEHRLRDWAAQAPAGRTA
jgi:HTH-type transcriptional regulator, competence development regulator